MSLNFQLLSSIKKVRDVFIARIASKFSLDSSELLELWDESSEEKTETPLKTSSVDFSDLSPERLNKCGKKELEALCRHHEVKVTGKKEDLISRLLKPEENKVKRGRGTGKKSAEEKVAKAQTKKTAEAKVLQDLKRKVSDTKIRRNNFGNFEHSDSRIVFNPKTKKARGRQQDDGSVSALDDDDIENCKRYNFSYDIPDNLDEENVKNAKIDELDDEESVQDVEDVEEKESVEESVEEIEDD